MLQIKPDKDAFIRVCMDVDRGDILTLKHIVDVFGWPAMELLLLTASPTLNMDLIQKLEDIRNVVYNQNRLILDKK